MGLASCSETSWEAPLATPQPPTSGSSNFTSSRHRRTWRWVVKDALLTLIDQKITITFPIGLMSMAQKFKLILFFWRLWIEGTIPNIWFHSSFHLTRGDVWHIFQPFPNIPVKCSLPWLPGMANLYFPSPKMANHRPQQTSGSHP